MSTDVGVDSTSCSVVFGQTLEEPGSDSTKFDQFVPTIVKPITRDTYVRDAHGFDHQVES